MQTVWCVLLHWLEQIIHAHGESFPITRMLDSPLGLSFGYLFIYILFFHVYATL